MGSTLDKLKTAIDSGQVAVLASGQQGTSYIEKNNHTYGGEVAGEEVQERDFEELLKRLRTRERPTYDAGWSTAWQAVSHKDAMGLIRRPLDWYQTVTGLKDYYLAKEAKVDRSLLRHVKEGGHIAEIPAKRICEALSQELGQPVSPAQIKWTVLN